MAKNRPHIALNFAMSIDGKISTKQRNRLRFSSKEDWKLMDEIRANADAVLIGANTIRSEDPPFRIRSKKWIGKRLLEGKTAQPISIILSNSLDLPINGRYFKERKLDRIIFTTQTASKEKLKSVSPFAEIIQTEGNKVDLNDLCRILFQRNIHKLVVEGGGEVNMAFFNAGLVDEIYMTLCPVIIGGREAPTPVDGVGFTADNIIHFELMETRKIGHEIFQRYCVKNNCP